MKRLLLVLLVLALVCGPVSAATSQFYVNSSYRDARFGNNTGVTSSWDVFRTYNGSTSAFSNTPSNLSIKIASDTTNFLSDFGYGFSNETPLPSYAAIDSAQFCVKGTGIIKDQFGGFGVSLSRFKPNQTTVLAINDWQTRDKLKYADDILYAQWNSTGGFNCFNITNLSIINTSSTTDIMLVPNYDIDGGLTHNGTARTSVLDMYETSATGTDNDPYLNITYHIAGAGLPGLTNTSLPKAMTISFTNSTGYNSLYIYKDNTLVGTLDNKTTSIYLRNLTPSTIYSIGSFTDTNSTWQNSSFSTTSAPLWPKVMFQFDDIQEESQYNTAYQIMSQYGMDGVTFVITSQIGTSGYMNSSEMTDMYNTGWDFGDHTVNHYNLVDGWGEPTIYYQINTAAMTLESLGLTRAARHFAPPGGQLNTTVKNIAITAGIKSIRAEIPSHNIIPNDSLEYNSSIPYDIWTTPTNTIIDAIDAGVTNETHIMVFHRISNVYGLYNYSIPNFTTIVDHVQDHGYQVITITEWYALNCEAGGNCEILPDSLSGITFSSTDCNSTKIDWTNPTPLGSTMIWRNNTWLYNVSNTSTTRTWTGLPENETVTFSSKTCNLNDYCNQSFANGSVSTLDCGGWVPPTATPTPDTTIPASNDWSTPSTMVPTIFNVLLGIFLIVLLAVAVYLAFGYINNSREGTIPSIDPVIAFFVVFLLILVGFGMIVMLGGKIS